MSSTQVFLSHATANKNKTRPVQKVGVRSLPSNAIGFSNPVYVSYGRWSVISFPIDRHHNSVQFKHTFFCCCCCFCCFAFVFFETQIAANQPPSPAKRCIRAHFHLPTIHIIFIVWHKAASHKVCAMRSDIYGLLFSLSLCWAQIDGKIAPFTANRALIKSFIHYATVLHFFRKTLLCVIQYWHGGRWLGIITFSFRALTFTLAPKVFSLLFHHQKSFTFLFTFYTNFKALAIPL